ncbi:MAG: hypothetical protein JSU00_26325 [Acidobacteria bacterium]|nr:hypothetical protein [Acidobacteriota bacterium]
MVRFLCIFVLFSTATFAQTMAEVGIAAAGGSAAGVAGKSVSTGIDRVRGLLEQAAKGVERSPMTPQKQLTLHFEPAAGTPGGGSMRRAVLASIAPGTSRQDLMALAGTPSSRIIMGDGGRLTEVYTYRNNGEMVGSVRLTDGEVTAVRISGK